MRKIDQILDELIDFKYQLSGPTDYVCAAAVIRDFSSIHVNPGRAVGKTSYIAHKSRSGDLVIVATGQEAAYMSRITKATVKSVTQLSYEGFDYRNYAWIWVDEPARCTAVLGDIKWLWGAKYDRNSFLVALGE